ncbi:MAG: sulfatase-like hydrolase/transferase, partial [Gammaproteobacteria bacterium]|nr:sulfatase-like hydrolase/transferase [Gammaproteobacteria bacterium]
NGYATGIVGKWHLGPDWEYIGGDEDYNDPGVKERVDKGYKIFTDYIKEVSGFDYAESIYGNNMHCIGIPKSMQYHNMEWITKGALDFIDQNKDKPFFLYMATTLPHAPGPVKSLNADPKITAAGFLDKPLDVQPGREDVFRRTHEAGFEDEAAPTVWLDDGVGSLLDRLDELNLAENTIIIFTSDHQSPGKMSCYEAAASAPAMIRWKGKIKPNQTSDELVTNVDIVPTILELCGINPKQPQEYDGQNLGPLLKSQNPVDRKSVYLEVIYTRAVVSDEWKYIAVRFPKEIQKNIT